MSGAHSAPVSKPRSSGSFKRVFLSEFRQGWLSLPRLPARPPATPAPVIPVPQGSLPQNRRPGSEPRGAQPAVGGQGVAGPPASILSMWAAGSDRLSLAHPLSACPILGSVVWREAFLQPCLVSTPTWWRRGTDSGGQALTPAAGALATQ